MLKKDKNSLFLTIKKWGLDPLDFNLEENGLLTTVSIKNSPLRFTIIDSATEFGKYECEASFFLYKYPTKTVTLKGGIIDGKFVNDNSIEAVIYYFTVWLRNDGKRYIDDELVTDLWSQSREYSTLSNSQSIPKDELLPFTSNEKIQVKQGLLNFKILLAENFHPVEEQLKTINERLDYLSNSVDRLNRFDWKAQALSTIVSIAVNLGVDTATGNKLLVMFQQALVHIAKYLPPIN